ncbi:MAG TPA: hypothetical protein VF100_11225 [Thermoanaerobaculia bacterium]
MSLTLPCRRRPGAKAAPTAASPPASAVAALAVVVLLAALPAAATPWPAPSYLAPLAEIGVRGGHVGWDGVEVGMTFRQVERAVGRLAAPASGPELLCPHHRTEAVVDGQRLELEFSGTGDDAVLRVIVVPLVPRLGETLDSRAVVAALRQRLDLDYVPSPHAPGAAEDEVEKPLFRTATDELVFVNPEAGVALGAVCVD